MPQILNTFLGGFGGGGVESVLKFVTIQDGLLLLQMRHLVNSRLFLLRKMWDNLLYTLLPNTWVPLYTMVTFTRERYHLCIAKKKWQDKVRAF